MGVACEKAECQVRSTPLLHSVSITASMFTPLLPFSPTSARHSTSIIIVSALSNPSELQCMATHSSINLYHHGYHLQHRTRRTHSAPLSFLHHQAQAIPSIAISGPEPRLFAISKVTLQRAVRGRDKADQGATQRPGMPTVSAPVVASARRQAATLLVACLLRLRLVLTTLLELESSWQGCLAQS